MRHTQIEGARQSSPVSRDACATRRQSRPRELPGPPVRIVDRRVSAVPMRDGGRPDLPVIGPADTPARIARRLV
jgi:hypothetical protein